MIRIGIDLGGTNIAVGAVDDGHAIVSRVSVPTLARRPAAEVVGDMGDAVEAALAKAGLSIGDCRSIGIGSPGTCNSAAGVVERAYNLGWDHVPVCRMLEERFHVPCRLSNDANCAALAEQVAADTQPIFTFQPFKSYTCIAGKLVLQYWRQRPKLCPLRIF